MSPELVVEKSLLWDLEGLDLCSNLNMVPHTFAINLLTPHLKLLLGKNGAYDPCSNLKGKECNHILEFLTIFSFI